MKGITNQKYCIGILMPKNRKKECPKLRINNANNREPIEAMIMVNLDKIANLLLPLGNINASEKESDSKILKPTNRRLKIAKTP